jgi:hypothetical protein
LFPVDIKPMIGREAARKARLEVDADAIGRLAFDRGDKFKLKLEFRVLGIAQGNRVTGAAARVRENVAFQVYAVAGLERVDAALCVAVNPSVH